ncbi:MAG: DapH/DapD/GlmU-related protein [Candidatus Freyarchaeum deiterrae]
MKKDQKLEEFKKRYESKGAPKLLLRLVAYLSVASIIAMIPIVGISYLLLEIVPLIIKMDIPWYLLISLAPVYVVLARWVFNWVLIAIGRLTLKPVEEGEYEMDVSNKNVKNWLINGLGTTLALHYVGFQPFGMPAFSKYVLGFLGAKMGYATQADFFADPYLAEFGDTTMIGGGAISSGHAFTSGRLLIGKIKLGRNVTIGANSVVFPGVEIGDNSIVATVSSVAYKTKIPPNQLWAGNPAHQIGTITKDGKIKMLEKEK